MYSNVIDQRGSVNASFWGCMSGQGPGKGLPANDTCGGSGAAYANNGGISANRTGHRLMKNLQIHVFKPFKTTSITQGVMVALMTCQYTKAPEEE